MKKILFVLSLFIAFNVLSDEPTSVEVKQESEVKNNSVADKKENITYFGIINFDNSSRTIDILKKLYDYHRDDKVKAIIFCVNSNGGSVGSFNHINNVILNIKKTKPVVAVVEDYALSGGYLAICSANYIITPEAGLLGSIGVYICYEKHFDPEYTGVGNHTGYKAKVKYEFFKTGKYKGIYLEHVPLTDDDRHYLQKLNDETYLEFCKLVANSRNLSLDKKEEWADAKMFSGTEAVKIGLADKIGSVFDAITKATELFPHYFPDQELGKIELIFPAEPAK